jgi:mitogen-activated protein kinase 15
MQFNPTKRISATAALRHPYVLQFHNPEDEFDCDRTIRIPIDDNTKLTVQDYRERLYNEVLRKKKEQRRSHRRHLELQQAAPQAVASGHVAYAHAQGGSPGYTSSNIHGASNINVQHNVPRNPAQAAVAGGTAPHGQVMQCYGSEVAGHGQYAQAHGTYQPAGLNGAGRSAQSLGSMYAKKRMM